MRRVSRGLGGLFLAWVILALAACGGGGGGGGGGPPSTQVNATPPSKVSYSATGFTFTAGVVSSTLTPTSAGGAVTSWSINPALPPGMSFSTTDGSISGTPTAPAAAAQYVVTAQNSAGQSTANLTITVGAAPFVTLGHQGAIQQIRATATRVLSEDANGAWILWDYATAAIITSGNSGCTQIWTAQTTCHLTDNFVAPTGSEPGLMDIVGTTAVLATATGLEVRSTTDGHVLGTIAASGTWWRLATDGSYITAGSTTGLSAWSISGQLLFSHAGDYSKAPPFAGPGLVSVGDGPAGANVIETIAVPSGTSSVGPQFNGTFSSWFADSASFITVAGSTDLIYSSAGVQQGAVTSMNELIGGTPVGLGNWVWSLNPLQGSINVYPATGTTAGTAPTVNFTFNWSARTFVSGQTIGVLSLGSNTMSMIDFSGTIPVRTDYTSSVYLGFGSSLEFGTPYAVVSPSQWLLGTEYGLLVDGASLGTTPRLFGSGAGWSIAAGTGHFAVATASGNIFCYNSATLALEGQIPYFASKVALSADGTLLVADGAGQKFGQDDMVVYSLTGGAPSLLYTWSYTNITGPRDVQLSASGTVLVQVTSAFPAVGYDMEASAPTGGSQIFSTPVDFVSVPARISPDGTLIAYSNVVAGVGNPPSTIPGSTLLQNGTLVTAFSGLVSGWLDNSRLVVNNYTHDAGNNIVYSGCTLYGPNGLSTGGACALPNAVYEFQPVPLPPDEVLPAVNDRIYVPATNQILSVSTGSVVWASGDPDTWALSDQPVSGVTGSRVIFVSGIDVVAQSY